MKQANPFYGTKLWKRKRAQILRRDGYRCQVSRRYGQRVEATTVHHIYPLEEYPQYALCGWNLISVSGQVNNRLHDRHTGKLTRLGMELQRRTQIPPSKINDG